MTKTEKKSTVVWKTVNWRKLEKTIFKLQKRIYQASQLGDRQAVQKLQKTLMKSWSARMLAVRKVTQDNAGKKTPGVDGVKSLTPQLRVKLAEKLKDLKKRKALPVRRIWIDKPGKKEKRPLGIPTMEDRAAQALVKLALEPEWEANFEPNSYGFRPGRSCHDAVMAIYISVNKQPKWVLDADISQCFDGINHEALLGKVNTFPSLRRIIKSWLKSGVIDWNRQPDSISQFSQTTKGVPQGGVLSPLLANIALHGMEETIQKAFPFMNKNSRETWFHKKGEVFYQPTVIRYADDFVILHKDKEVIQHCQHLIEEWLQGMGLKLKPEKTKIAHSLQHGENRRFVSPGAAGD